MTKRIFTALSKKIENFKWIIGYSSLPNTIDLYLTDDCNLNCSYCPRTEKFGFQNENRENRHMDTDKLFALMDQLTTFRPTIRFLGGEPFLHPDWESVIKQALTKELPHIFITNGTLINKHAERIVQSGLTDIGISLDGYESSHSLGRGKNITEIVIKGIDVLNYVKQQYNSVFPNIHIFTTINENNYHRIVDFAHFLKNRNISLYRLQHLIWFTAKHIERSMEKINKCLPDAKFLGSEPGFVHEKAPNIDCDVLAEQIRILKETDFPFDIVFCPDLTIEKLKSYHSPDYQFNPNHPCRVLENCSYIDSRGRVYPCLTLDMGNTFEKPFISVWNGRRSRKFRALIRRENRLPVCVRCPS